MPGRPQKLPERKRPEGAKGDSADREREAALLQPNLHQRTGRHDRKLGVVFVQEAQPANGLRAFLDLVEKDQSAIGKRG